jgi:hypothetical protein
MSFKQGEGNEPLLKHGGSAAGAWDLVCEYAKDAAEAAAAHIITGVGGVLVLLGQKVAELAGGKIKDTALGKWLLSKIGNQDFITLSRLNAQDIQPLLSNRLGSDLEEHLPRREGKSCKAVIFLDTFEALRIGTHSEALGQMREEWIPRVLALVARHFERNRRPKPADVGPS